MWKHKHIFMRKRGSNIHLGKFSFTNQNFKVRNASMFQTQLFTHFTTFLRLETFFSKLEKTFSSSNFSWHRQSHSRLHFHFSSKIRKLTSFWIETHFFMIWHENFNLRISTPNLRILDQNLIFAHEIHCSAYMTSISVSASNLLIFWWNLVFKSKTSQNSYFIFWIISNTFKIQVIFKWLFTYPHTNGWWGFKCQ